MHAVEFLHKFIKKSCFSIHPVRLNTLFVAVNGLVNKKRLTLTGIGRAIRDGSKAKHAIKRIDRLISNPHLYAERDSIYQALSSKLIGNKKHPDILIDWSPMPNLNYQLLRATLAGKGRSRVLYEAVHPARKLGNRNIQRLFLEQLKSLLPPDCQPTIITDAGFKNPWFRAVSALGWHWIGRVRGKVQYATPSNHHWQACRSLHATATHCAKRLGHILLTQRDKLPCQLILFKGKAQGRHRKNADGKPCKSKSSRVYAKRNREPWDFSNVIT